MRSMNIIIIIIISCLDRNSHIAIVLDCVCVCVCSGGLKQPSVESKTSATNTIV